jgi:hypothetical protein
MMNQGNEIETPKQGEDGATTKPPYQVEEPEFGKDPMKDGAAPAEAASADSLRSSVHFKKSSGERFVETGEERVPVDNEWYLGFDGIVSQGGVAMDRNGGVRKILRPEPAPRRADGTEAEPSDRDLLLEVQSALAGDWMENYVGLSHLKILRAKIESHLAERKG